MKINGNPDGGGGASAVIEGLSVTSNGTYTAGGGVDGYSPVEVNVPSPEFVTETLSVSVNNTYYPGQGVDGFSQVVVDVPQSVSGFTEKEITEQTYAIYNLNNSASFVHRNVFEEDLNILTVNLPNASYIGSQAFMYCRNLTSVNAPVCEMIWFDAFTDCNNLSYVSFPKLKNVNGAAFQRCSALTTVSLPEFVGAPTSNDGAGSMFNGCSNLSSVYLPKLSKVYGQMFAYTNISEITLLNCIIAGWNAFNGASKLQTVSLPMCGSTENGCFQNCSTLTTLYIALDVYPQWINNSTGLNSNIESIYTHVNNISIFTSNSYWSSYSSKFIGVGDPGEYMLSYSDGTVSGLTRYLYSSISNYFSIDKSLITHISLPNCISFEQGWDDRAPFFDLSQNLLTVDMPALTNIPIKTFRNCPKLTTVNIPLCESIGMNAFLSCSSLGSINFPECVSISDGAFAGCISLSAIDLPKCKYIASTAFWACGFTTSINLPACEYIGWRGFGLMQQKSAGISMYLPVCSFISADAFFQCYSAINQITLGWSSVCQLGGDPFGYYTYISYIYVPSSLVDAYKSAPYWSNYSNKIFPIE